MPPSLKPGKKASSPKRRSSTAPTTRKTSTKTPGTGTRRSASGSQGKGRPASNRLFSLPLAALWFLAIVVLAGLVYWGKGAPGFTFTRTQPSHDAEAKKAAPPAGDKVAKNGVEPDRGHGATAQAGPVRKPVETSEDGRGTAGDEGRTAKNGKEAEAAVPREEKKPETPEPPRSNGQLLAMNAGTGVNLPPPAPREPVPDISPVAARAALVIDDLGQDVEMAKRFLKLPIQITFSVLPFLPHSTEVAEIAHAGHREVILHLPMEPQEYPSINPGPGALLISMNNDRIRKAVRSALDVSPYFAGMNNHMGSRFTEHSSFMREVLSELKQRGLYFIDSCTSPASVGYSVAQSLHVASRRRDIFLDHNMAEASVRSQVDQFIRKAKVEGSAIAIGHPHEITLRVLEQEAPRFRQEGILIVPASELMAGRPQEGKKR